MASFPAGTAPPPKCFIGNQHAPLQTPTHRQRGLAERTATRKNSARTSPRSPPSKGKSHPLFRLLPASNPPNRSKPCPELSRNYSPTALGLSNSVPRTPLLPAWHAPSRAAEPSASRVKSCPKGPQLHGAPHAGGFGTGHASSAHPRSPRHRRTRP